MDKCMKKMMWFALIWMAGLGTLKAQWSVTPEAGMALTKRNGFQTDWTGRPKIGVGVEYQLPSSSFALKSGLYYMQRGYSAGYGSGMYLNGYGYGYSWGYGNGPWHPSGYLPSYGGGNGGYGYGGYGGYHDYAYDYGSTLKRHFLQVPVMVDFSFPLADEVRLHVAAGPYIAVSVADHWDGYTGYLCENAVPNSAGTAGSGGYGSYNAAPTRGFDPTRGLRAFDWGVSGVLGLEVKQWMFNFAYDLSLGKEYKHGSVGVNYHTVSLSVGYKFKLGK